MHESWLLALPRGSVSSTLFLHPFLMSGSDVGPRLVGVERLQSYNPEEEGIPRPGASPTPHIKSQKLCQYWSAGL